MSHFASSQWSIGLAGDHGPVARFETLTHAAAVAATTVFTATKAGFYRIEGAMQTLVVGTGASQTWDIDLEVTGAAADTTANFVAAVDALTLGDGKTGTMTVYLPVGGLVKYTTNSNGTVTTAAVLAVGVHVTAI